VLGVGLGVGPREVDYAVPVIRRRIKRVKLQWHVGPWRHPLSCQPASHYLGGCRRSCGLGHIHVEQAERFAKFWLTPVALAHTHGFRSSELTELTNLVIEHRALFEEKWNEHLRHQS
jgi:Domain of unknown function (DUF4160)